MPNILSRAELLLQAKNYSGTGAWLDESGNSHDAQLGSTAGADTNDPEFLAHSGDNYVRLPGSSGNYVSSADVNLLDADTAHLQQSISDFVVDANCVVTRPTDQPLFGDYSLKVVADGVGHASIKGSPDSHAVSSSTEYTLSVDAIATTGTQKLQIQVLWYTSAPAYISQDNGTATDVGSTATRLSVTATSPGTAAYARIIVTTATDVPSNLDTFYFGKFCLRAGSDATFVPSLRIVGDVELESKLAIATTQPTGTAGIFCYSNSSVTARHDFTFYNDAGTLYMFTYNSTGNGSREVSLDGEVHTYKWQQIVSGADRIARFYVDGVQAGSDATIAGSATLANTPPSYGVGGRSIDGATNLDGDIYYAEVRDGIGGPVVARYDADDASEPFATQTGATDGRSWTYNRSGSGLYVVDRPAFGLHTDDYFVVADDADLDFGAGDDFTLIAVVRNVDYRPSTATTWIDKRSDWNDGWFLASPSSTGDVQAYINDAGTADIAYASGATDLYTYAVAGRLDRTAGTLQAFIDGVGGTADSGLGVGSMVNAADLYIGRVSYTADTFMNGEIMAVALFREALTDDEVLQVSYALSGIAPGRGYFNDVDALGALRDRLIWDAVADGTGTWTEANAPRELVGALNAFLGTSAGDVEGALNAKAGTADLGAVAAINSLLSTDGTAYEVNDGLRQLAEMYNP